jgi:acetylornithine/N-succinyldiaminopimelate aminotransferase
MNLRQLFMKHVAQTSPAPLALEIVKASGCTLTDASGRNYIDLIGGISVANIGHSHPQLISAVKEQLDHYLHIMVYGEFIHIPQVQYAKLLTDNLPGHLDSVYFTNSGAEAVEGAMKLAKRVTGRTEICCFNFSYHGSTQGALSIIGDEYWRNAYRPLLPGIQRLNYNSFPDLELITESTACVIVETVQAEAGIIEPQKEWLQSLAATCKEKGALLIMDEVQAGFGRTGKLWGFGHFDVNPDILILGKALGGGLPLGAFIANREVMNSLADNPVLGHITTFGGHALCCTAGLEAMKILLESNWVAEVQKKEQLFIQLLVHPAIKAIRSFGLWMAVEFDSFDICKRIIDKCIAEGVLTDWFLFASNCLRICPPLVITEEEIKSACAVIVKAIDESAVSQ